MFWIALVSSKYFYSLNYYLTVYHYPKFINSPLNSETQKWTLKSMLVDMRQYRFLKNVSYTAKHQWNVKHWWAGRRENLSLTPNQGWKLLRHNLILLVLCGLLVLIFLFFKFELFILYQDITINNVVWSACSRLTLATCSFVSLSSFAHVPTSVISSPTSSAAWCSLMEATGDGPECISGLTQCSWRASALVNTTTVCLSVCPCLHVGYASQRTVYFLNQY